MITSLLALVVAQAATSPAPPLRIQSGDVLAVYVAGSAPDSPYSGDYPVMSDGSVYGIAFGRIPVAGHTWEEAQSLLREKLKRMVRPGAVFLAIKKERLNYAYVVGANSPGPVVLPPNPVTVRQLLPPLSDKQDGQRLDVEFVRGGKTLARFDYAKLLQGAEPFGNTVVQPNDLISIVPQASIRIWVLGAVKAPGQLALPVGTNIYEAVATAGGFLRLDMDSSLTLRHGADITTVSSHFNPAEQLPDLADGDIITAVAPEIVRVTIAGEVQKPGDYPLLDNTTILGALGSASGTLPSGNLNDVIVYRNGELLTFDLSGHRGNAGELKQTVRGGDTIIVGEKLHTFFVFGEVRQPGRFPMDDHKTYHAADALAMAGGLTTTGTLRYVYLMHPVTNGKPLVTQFNLDEYLKDGTVASNPEVLPGDSLLFGQPRGISLTAIAQVLSSYVIVTSLSRP